MSKPLVRGAILAAFVCGLGAAAAGCSGCSDKSAAASLDATAIREAHLDAGDAAPSANETVFDDSAMPATSGDDLNARMRHLLEAIAQNNPDLASDALFPRDAYVSLKEGTDPGKAWDKNVSGPFGRSIDRLHKRTKGIEHARFVSFEIGRSMVQLSPSKANFKKPLWRVKHSKITFSLDGKQRQIDIAEMTAWRGAWYVTRLR